MRRPLTAATIARLESVNKASTAPPSLSAAELRRIAEMAASDPLRFAERIDSLGIDARSLLGDDGIRSLDSDHSQHLDHEEKDHSDPHVERLHGAHDDSYLDDPRVSAFTRRALATLTPLARTGDSLVRLSLTVPRDRQCGSGSLRITSRRFVREVEARGILLASDRRKDGAEHAYAIAVTNDARRDVERWCALTGASLKRACRYGAVTGWRALQEHGELGPLEENLERVVRYAGHAYSDGEPRREADVMAAGVLEPLRSPFLELACPGLGYGASRSPVGLPGAGKASTGRECARCGRELAGRKRSHAVWCGPSCKTLASRERRRAVRS
jgi:hypothetical protein